MKIWDLGSLDGTLGLFGGAYSNLEATQALFADMARRGIAPSHIIFTGDAVAYGGDPVATLEALKDSGCAITAGNVERALAAGAGDCGCGFTPGSTCDQLSAPWFAFADQMVDPTWRYWMQDLPDLAVFAHEGRRYAVVHGGLTDIARFIWPSSPESVFQQEITAIEAAAGPVDGIIAGHCGMAFERVVAGVHWINAGAIGMPPHDGRPLTRFATLTAAGAQFHRLAYNHTAAADRMRHAGLVQGYERALEKGYWPSEDVLPKEMRG